MSRPESSEDQALSVDYSAVTPHSPLWGSVTPVSRAFLEKPEKCGDKPLTRRQLAKPTTLSRSGTFLGSGPAFVLRRLGRRTIRPTGSELRPQRHARRGSRRSRPTPGPSLITFRSATGSCTKYTR